MDRSLDRLFLNVSADRLRQFAARIKTCLEKLTYEQIWTRGTENENAIGNLVLHLCGNVRQWIVSGVAGQPDVRVRDAEFAARGGLEPGELRERLEGTVRQAVAVLGELPDERLKERVTIQSYEVTLLEAVYHVVEHFAQHTGQIIYATKLMTGEDLGFYRHLSRPGSCKAPDSTRQP
jgi:uncharacterized damage-inducible protein DinB